MRTREEGLIPLVVGTREDCAAVEEDLDDLVVVSVRRQDQRRDVRGEGRRVRGDRLPALDYCQEFSFQSRGIFQRLPLTHGSPSLWIVSS